MGNIQDWMNGDLASSYAGPDYYLHHRVKLPPPLERGQLSTRQDRVSKARCLVNKIKVQIDWQWRLKALTDKQHKAKTGNILLMSYGQHLVGEVTIQNIWELEDLYEQELKLVNEALRRGNRSGPTDGPAKPGGASQIVSSNLTHVSKD